MDKIQMVDLKGQMKDIKTEILAAFEATLDKCDFIKGGYVREFTAKMETYLGEAKTIPCANGTDALQIALMALNLEPGDEVITTPFTFVATAEVIALLNLKPVFVDIHPDTFLIDETKIEESITKKTKCIIPVHLFGQGANMESIMEIAKKHNLFVVEDNAQAIGADYIFSNGNKQKLGTIGDVGCTSFFPSKNLGCYGDGGALFTKDEELAKKINIIVDHGSAKRYYHSAIGVNSRLDTLQAAVLLAKLPRLDSYNAKRIASANYYDKKLKGIAGIKTPQRATWSTHVFHQYTILIENGNRDKVVEAFKKENIPCGVYYPVPLHLQEAYTNDVYEKGDMPISERASQSVMSLPMHTELTEEMQDYIVDMVVGNLD